MKRFITVFFCVWAGLGGCKKETEVRFESLEDTLPSITTKAELVTFLTGHPELRDHVFGRSSYPNDSVFINQLFRRFTDLSMDTLLDDAHRVFGNGAELKEQFRTAFANIQSYYPDFKPPKIQTIITGMETDLFVSDTLVVIGLDYFLGSGARYRPNMYDYMLRRYTKNFIVPSVLLLYGIDPHFNKTELTDKTVLADMIAYGKAYYFAKRMLPDAADSVLIGYTTEEINSAKENEDLIYAVLIEKEVIYATSHMIKQRYMAERPKTLEIGERCPGRIGQWIGWQIVEEYARRNPGKRVPEIMAITQATTIFRDSKYRPEKNIP
jgi:hypothetical protein